MPPHRLKPLLTTVAEHIDLIVQLSHSEGTLSMADILHACDETGVPPEVREALCKRLAAQRILVQDMADELRVNPALTAFLNHYERLGQLVSATFLAEQFQHLPRVITSIRQLQQQSPPDLFQLVTVLDHLNTQLHTIRQAAEEHHQACMRLLGDLRRNDQHHTLGQRIEHLQQAQRRYIDPLAELIAPQTNAMAQIHDIQHFIAQLAANTTLTQQSHELQRLLRHILEHVQSIEQRTLRQFGELIDTARTILASLVSEKSRKDAVAFALGHLDASWELLQGVTIVAPQRRSRRMSSLESYGAFFQDVLAKRYLPNPRPLQRHVPEPATHASMLLTTAQLRTMVEQASHIASWPTFIAEHCQAYPLHEQIKAMTWPLLRNEPQMHYTASTRRIRIAIQQYTLELNDFAVDWHNRRPT